MALQIALEHALIRLSGPAGASCAREPCAAGGNQMLPAFGRQVAADRVQQRGFAAPLRPTKPMRVPGTRSARNFDRSEAVRRSGPRCLTWRACGLVTGAAGERQPVYRVQIGRLASAHVRLNAVVVAPAQFVHQLLQMGRQLGFRAHALLQPFADGIADRSRRPVIDLLEISG